MKGVKALMGFKTGQCSIEENTTSCFRNEKIFKLSQAAVRVISIAAIDQYARDFTIKVNYGAKKSCFESQYLFKRKNVN